MQKINFLKNKYKKFYRDIHLFLHKYGKKMLLGLR